MTDDQRIDEIINCWQKILLLGDWKIAWRWEEAMGIDGRMAAHTNEQEAEIYLKPSVVKNYGDAEAEALIMHELIEILMAPIYDYLSPWLNAYLPLVVHQPVCDGLNDIAINRVVEDLVRILKEGR